MIRFGRSRSVVVRNVVTEEETVFETATEAAKELGVSSAALSGWINDKKQPVVHRLIQIKWLDDLSPWRKVSDPYLEYQKQTNKKVVCVVGVHTDVIEIYLSAAECARWNNISVTALNQRLKSNFGVIYGDGKRYGYYSRENILGSSSVVIR